MLNSLMLTIILDEEVFVNYVKEGMWELCAAPECPAPKVNIEICRIYIYIYILLSGIYSHCTDLITMFTIRYLFCF